MNKTDCTDTMSSFVSPTGSRHGAALAGGTRAKGGVLQTVIHTLFVWQERARSRAEMRRMDLKMLDDVGLTYEDARAEFKKPFWVA